MSAPQKLHAGKESELTRLKEIWRRMADDARSYWRERFVSSEATQAQIRQEIFAKLKVNLKFDSKLNAFRGWVDSQEQRELMAEKIEERKQELLSGGMTLEQAQDVLLSEASAYSVASRDFKLGLKASAEISKRSVTQLDRQKFEFDATKAAMAKLDSLKKIKTSTLSEDEKLQQARLELFGTAPK